MVDLPFPVPLTPSAPDVGVRPAHPRDASDIAAVQLAVWRRQYADLLPSAAFDLGTQTQMAQHWAESISAPPTSTHAVLVATAGRLVVGYAVTAPVDDDAGAGEITDLQVHPDASRLGHGSRLLSAAVEHLRERGCTAVVAWTGATDTARRTFLESAGLAEDGVRRRLDMGERTVGVDEVRLGARLE
jgi:ribosomal protein S18 acetylase RimI-like enzyme